MECRDERTWSPRGAVVSLMPFADAFLRYSRAQVGTVVAVETPGVGAADAAADALDGARVGAHTLREVGRRLDAQGSQRCLVLRLFCA